MTLAPAELAAVQSTILDWYATNARHLAFRRTTDPWSVLVSEVIAQQTQAERAAAAWERFIAQFPTPSALAAASPATVIRAWRGLGYNRRAVALRAAAIAIVEVHRGRVPDSYDALVALPGIGPYTARAVLAIAFDQSVAALDTNIRRVVGRAFLSASQQPERDFQAAADGFVPPRHAAAWTHALMDIGARFCRKREPRCDPCPIASSCRYLATGRPPGPADRRARSRPVPFPQTTRWLRGRILDRLRDVPDRTFVAFDSSIGVHGLAAVREEIRRLHAEGLLEFAPGDPARARLIAD